MLGCAWACATEYDSYNILSLRYRVVLPMPSTRAATNLSPLDSRMAQRIVRRSGSSSGTSNAGVEPRYLPLKISKVTLIVRILSARASTLSLSVSSDKSPYLLI